MVRTRLNALLKHPLSRTQHFVAPKYLSASFPESAGRLRSVSQSAPDIARMRADWWSSSLESCISS